MTSVLSRWWKLKVPNTYKEAAWWLTLNVRSCPVAVAVRKEIEGQLRAFDLLPADGILRCAELWLGLKPAQQLHRLVGTWCAWQVVAVVCALCATS